MRQADNRIGTDGKAVVLVRATSPYLPKNVLQQRERRCIALAAELAGTVDLLPRFVDAPFEKLSTRPTGTPVAAVVTWSAYGLVTSADELAAAQGLLASGVAVYEAQSGQLVPVTAQRLADSVPARSSSASSEVRRHAARTREGRQAVAREGRWLGGRCPLGWIVDADGDATLDVTAAGYIRTAMMLVADGGKVGTVVAQWNAAGFTTVTGRGWTFGSARRVLLRARNAGLVEYRGNIVGRSAWPAIVTVDEWRRVRQRLVPRPEQRIA